MKDVGIITMHRVINYGSVLQAFATQKVIEKLGYSCELIDYVYPNKKQVAGGHPYIPHTLRSKIAKLLWLKAGWRKVNKFQNFYRRYLNLSDTYWSASEVHANPPRYKCYLTGSDQVWNPKYTKGDTTFLLDFVENTPCISYASSFACATLPKDLIPQYADLLKKYQALSVREENGTKIIHDLLGQDVPVVVDPTLLLTQEDWLSLVDIAVNNKNPKYILVYILKYALDPSSVIYPIIESIQKETKLKVIFLGSEGFVSHKDWHCVAAPSPKDFVRLFAEASCVVTSSFHGTAFGVNFAKPVFSVVNSQTADDRITTFLKSVGLFSSIISVTEETKELQLKQNTDLAQEKLSQLRKYSIDFLRESLAMSMIKK